MCHGSSAYRLEAILMNSTIQGETWRKQICWKHFLPWRAPAGWMTGCWLAGWQADWCMCVRVGTAGDKPRSSLLPIRVPGLKNNFPIVARKSKTLNVSFQLNSYFRLRGRSHNFGVMIIQLQATQTVREEDRYKQRSPIYHISLCGLTGIATSAFVT